MLQAVADAVSSPLIIASSGQYVEAANDLAVQLLRPDTALADGGASRLLRMPLAELLEVVGGQMQAGCIADCITRLPSGATVPVKCDFRRCDLPGHPDLLFVNLWPGVTEPDAFDDEEELEDRHYEGVEEEAVALNHVRIQSLKILLVEDDRFSASVITELCRSCDFSVEARPAGRRSRPGRGRQPPPQAQAARACGAEHAPSLSTAGGEWRQGVPAAAAREHAAQPAERAV